MPAPTWNLETIFSGGPQGPSFSEELAAVEALVEDLVGRGDALPELPDGLESWSSWLLDDARVLVRAAQLSTFAHCNTCADASDGQAARLAQRTENLFGRRSRGWVGPTDRLANSTDEGFTALTRRPELADHVIQLTRIRRNRHLLLPREQQAVVAELRGDGIEGWGNLYDRISGALQVRLGEETVSVGQAQNRLGSTERSERVAAFSGIREAWSSAEDGCAQALTHIVGWRQSINDRRGVDELADTLARNRLTRGTLDAMMEASASAQPLLKRYFEAKASLLGVDQMGWEDIAAPLPAPDSQQDWPQAEAFVLEHFHSYNPELADFAKKAFDERWIEAEDRSGKRQGGWCANLPGQGESRIFMTHGGTFRSTVTLAHELGHAYHNWVTRDLPLSRRQITSTLAETASVFAESLVRDAALEAASSRQARLAMLDARLSAGASFLMNLPARYAFERALYPLRRKGPFDPAKLSELMERCQREAYGEALSSWFPEFWAAKLHFYISHFAFYNYPYTFGYLFAQLVYRQVRASGDHSAYVELLRRTGWDDSEPLAREALGLDLEEASTWRIGVKGLEDDLDAFLAEIQGS